MIRGEDISIWRNMTSRERMEAHLIICGSICYRYLLAKHMSQIFQAQTDFSQVFILLEAIFIPEDDFDSDA